MSMLASNLEVIVKTEPYLRFKKELFKDIVKDSDEDEEILRRKFYKLLETYLTDGEIKKSDFPGIKVSKIVRKLNKKFRDIGEGSFVLQGDNVGYIQEGKILWVRHDHAYDDQQIVAPL